MNKEGVSTVVASVLVILITVTSVSLVWFGVMPMVGDIDLNVNPDLVLVSDKGYTLWDDESSEDESFFNGAVGLFEDVFLTGKAVFGVMAAGELTADINASRLSCVAPCPIFFEGTGSHDANDKSIDDGGLHGNDIVRYAWDFGAGTELDVSSGGRYFDGFNSAHVFESSGNYTVILNVTDVNGNSSVSNVSVEILNFSGDVYCFSNDGDFTGCSGGDYNVTTTTWSGMSGNDVLDYVGVNRSLLLKRGDRFEFNSSEAIGDGPLIISSFGTGSKPFIDYIGNWGNIWEAQGIYSAGDNVSITDLSFNTINGTSRVLSSSDGSRRNLLLLRDDFNSSMSYSDDLMFFIDSNISDTMGQIFSLNAEYAVFINSDIGPAYEHAVYGYCQPKSIFYGNRFHDINLENGGRVALRLSGNACYSDNIIVKNNIFEDTPSTAAIQLIVTTAAAEPYTVHDVLIEKNFFANTSGIYIVRDHGFANITIKNNVFKFSDYALSVTESVSYNPSWAKDVDSIWVYNNVMYGADNTSGYDVVIIEQENITDFRFYNNVVYSTSSISWINAFSITKNVLLSSLSIDNNLYYFPNKNANIFHINGTASNFAWWQTQGFDSEGMVADPGFVGSGLDVAEDFKVGSGSVAIDNGTALVGVFDDYDGVLRPQGGGFDIGAFEYVVAVASSLVEFVPPTPADGANQSATNVEINVTIEMEDLDEVLFGWDGVNYSVYDDSLVLMYNFDNVSLLGENDGLVVDVSGSGISGTWTGDTDSDSGPTSNGKHNGAFNFDGDSDRISLGTQPDKLNFSHSPFTISVWVYLKESKSQYVIKKGDPFANSIDDNQWAMSFGSSENLYCEIGNGTEGISIMGDSISLNEWHHVTCKLNESDYLIAYIDGVEQSDKILNTLGADAADQNVYVGFLSNNGYYFNGSMDELRIWNRSLSNAEIQESYFTNLKKYDSNLWNLYVNQSYNSTNGLLNGTYYYGLFSANATGNASLAARTIDIGTFDYVAPSSISNLQNISKDGSWIYWNWTNPLDSDFDFAIIYINGVNVQNTSNNFYNATGLNYSTSYNITVNTVDIYQNINHTNISNSVTTFGDLDLPTFTSQSTIQNLRDSPFSFDVNANDSSGIDSFTINDSISFTINSTTGIITNITSLSLGFYYLNVSVNDSLGNTVYQILSIEIVKDFFDKGLVLWLEFEDDPSGGIINDSSESNYNGTCDGTCPSLSTDAKQGNYSYNISRGDWFTFGNSTNTTLEMQEMTISFWVNVIEAYSEDVILRAGQGYKLSYSEEFEKFNFRIDKGGSKQVGIRTKDKNKEGYWYHLTMKWDGQNMSSYIDGKLEYEDPTSNLESSNYPIIYESSFRKFLVGSSPYYTSEPRSHMHSNILIDDLRVYNRSLSSLEIQRLSQGELRGGANGEIHSCPKQYGVCVGSNQTFTTEWEVCDDTKYFNYDNDFETKELTCNDGLDNDCDGFTDRDDNDCALIEASRTTGIAPLAIFFDGRNDFNWTQVKSYQFLWDFNDSTIDEGYIVSHVFKNPGNYTVNLTIKNNSNVISSDTLKIVINNFTGRTLCYSEENNFSDCPSSNNSDHFTNYTNAWGNLTTNTSLLFHRGENYSFTENFTKWHVPGPITFATYGRGNKPFINGNLNTPFLIIGTNDLRIMNLEFINLYNIGLICDDNDKNCQNYYIDGVKFFNMTYGGVLFSNPNSNFFVYNTEYINMWGRYVYFTFTYQNFAFVNTTWINTTDERFFRIQGGENFILRNSYMHINPIYTHHDLFTLRGAGFNTRDIILKNNSFSHEKFMPTLGPQNTNAVGAARSVIIEQNKFIALGTYTHPIAFDGYELVVRNNKFFNVSSFFMTNGRGKFISSSFDIDLYNNAVYSDTIYKMVFFPSSFFNFNIYNNAIKSNSDYLYLYSKNLSEVEANYNIYDISNTNSSINGTIINLAEWQAMGNDVNSIFADPEFLSLDPASSDFLKINSSSPAYNNGTTVPVFDDYYGTSRPQNELFDIGVFEYVVDIATTVSAVLNLNDSILRYGIDSVNVSWDASSDGVLDVIVFNVSYPNGSILFESGSAVGNVVLGPLGLSVVGTYGVNIWANDTNGSVDSSFDSFEVRPLRNVSIGTYSNLSLEIVRSGTGEVVYFEDNVSTHNTSLSEGNYSFRFRFNGDRFRVTLEDVNVSSNYDRSFGVRSPLANDNGYVKTYGVSNADNILFSNAVVRFYYDDLGISASGENYLELHKCEDWNFSNGVCNGSYVDISSNASQNLTGNYFEFNVSSFSGFSVEQLEYCGDGVSNNGETCESCAVDYGACVVASSSGGGGGGSSGVTVVLEESVEGDLNNISLRLLVGDKVRRSVVLPSDCGEYTFSIPSELASFISLVRREGKSVVDLDFVGSFEGEHSGVLDFVCETSSYSLFVNMSVMAEFVEFFRFNVSSESDEFFVGENLSFVFDFPYNDLDGVYNALIKYTILDVNGSVVLSGEDVVVLSGKSFVQDFEAEGLFPGEYSLVAGFYYGDVFVESGLEFEILYKSSFEIAFVEDVYYWLGRVGKVLIENWVVLVGVILIFISAVVWFVWLRGKGWSFVVGVFKRKKR